METPPPHEASHATKGLVRLTWACDAACSFCNLPVEEHQGSPPEVDLDAFAGEQTLTVSGGEPTLYRERLLALIGAARARGIPFVELQTHAQRIDADYARSLLEAGLTSAFVALHADRALEHDTLLGRQGSWARTVAGIDALLGAGVRVTLNPVLTRPTQDRVLAYVTFVAQRFPAVRAISLSALQPHGRARSGDLLPDYAVLRRQVPGALRAAREHGIVVVNPYCGLPACVGWSEHLDNSVEAVEPGRLDAPGVTNRGDKEHRAPCLSCDLRPWCGGAWRAVWELRGGAGVGPPPGHGPPPAVVPVTTRRRGQDGVDLPLADLPLRPGTVWLGGGEPTLRPDLPALIAHVAAHAEAALETDGLALTDPRVVRNLRAVGLRRVRIALHSSRPDAHDWVAGLPGAHRRARLAFAACREAGLDVEGLVVLARPVVPHLVETLALHARLGAGSVLVRRPLATGPDAVARSPRLERLGPVFEQTLRVPVPVTFEGFPPCLAPTVPSRRFRPLVESGFDGCCAGCPGPPTCGGRPADYVERFGWATSPP